MMMLPAPVTVSVASEAVPTCVEVVMVPVPVLLGSMLNSTGLPVAPPVALSWTVTWFGAGA